MFVIRERLYAHPVVVHFAGVLVFILIYSLL